MDIKAISTNIQRLTEKEKQTFFESLLGNMDYTFKEGTYEDKLIAILK